MVHPLLTIRAILLGLLTLVCVIACASPAPSAAPPAATASNQASPAPAATTAPPKSAPSAPAAGSPAPAAASPTPAAAGGTPRRGGTAVIAVDADPESLNPGITTSNVTGDVQAKVFEGLVWLDQDGTPQPALATSWQISPDGKTYTFKLRPNVKWHDGRDFTSADVKFTFEEILPKFHPRTSTTFKRLELTVDAPDPLTATLTLKQPYAPLLIQMSVFEAPVMPMHLYQGTDPTTNPANQAPVGTGPFKFAEWNRGTSIKVVRNDKYWDTEKPYLDSIIFQVVPQGPNRSTGLETGELDFVLDFYLPKADVGRLSANTNLISKRGQGAPAIDFVMFNVKHPVLANKQVRQALASAVNRQTQVQQAMGGLGRPGSGAFGDGFRWLVNPDVSYDKLYPFNADKAKQMLAAAAVPANTTLRLTYDAARPNFVTGAQIIKDNLRQGGINVDLQPLERTVMIDKIFTQKDFDLTLQSYFSSGDPSIGYHRLYLTNTGNAPFVNASGYSNPQVDDLLTKASVAPTQDERAPIYKQLQTILNDDLPALILYDESGVDFATKKLNALWTSIDSRNRWDVVWLTP